MPRLILIKTVFFALLLSPMVLRAGQQPPATGNETPPASTDSGKEGKPKSLTKKSMPIVNRVWTDVSGIQTTAKFVRIVGDRVVLGWGAKTTIVPFGELSSGDQEYVKQVLTSQGQAALIPGGNPPAVEPSADPAVDAKGNPAGGLEFSRGPAPRGPNDPAPPPTAGAETTTAGEPSSLFEEMRKRDEERRQERGQDSAQFGQPPAEQPTPAEPTPAATAQEPAPAADSPLAAPFDAQTIADAKEMFIIGGIIMAVISTVGFIVWVAITIASRSSVSHQRRYF